MNKQERKEMAAAAMVEILANQQPTLRDDTMCFLVIEHLIVEAYGQGLIDGINKLGDRVKERRV